MAQVVLRLTIAKVDAASSALSAVVDRTGTDQSLRDEDRAVFLDALERLVSLRSALRERQ